MFLSFTSSVQEKQSCENVVCSNVNLSDQKENAPPVDYSLFCGGHKCISNLVFLRAAVQVYTVQKFN